MIDLHIHTKISDGQYSVQEILQKSVNSGISVIAITDHDTVGGLDEAKKCVAELEKNGQKITLVKGVELQIEWHMGEFHLLGLGLKEISKTLQILINDLQKYRMLRNAEIVKRMRAHDIDVTLTEIENEFSGQVIGRPHFAEFLVRRGLAKNMQAAFKKYLRWGKEFYVERRGANLDEAIIAITESGGAPVIAHPLSLYLSWSKLEKTLVNLYERGIAGIEAYHPGATLHECKRLEDIARKIGLFVTAGSDFHGEKIRADRKLGHSAGGKEISDRFWTEELEPYLIKTSQDSFL